MVVQMIQTICKHCVRRVIERKQLQKENKMPKFKVEITHVSGTERIIEADDRDHAMEIASNLSDESKPDRKFHLESSWTAEEITD